MTRIIPESSSSSSLARVHQSASPAMPVTSTRVTSALLPPPVTPRPPAILQAQQEDSKFATPSHRVGLQGVSDSPSTSKSKNTRIKWTTEEDNELARLMRGPPAMWEEIASHFPGRTTAGCSRRWNNLRNQLSPVPSQIMTNTSPSSPMDSTPASVSDTLTSQPIEDFSLTPLSPLLPARVNSFPHFSDAQLAETLALCKPQDSEEVTLLLNQCSRSQVGVGVEEHWKATQDYEQQQLTRSNASTPERTKIAVDAFGRPSLSNGSLPVVPPLSEAEQELESIFVSITARDEEMYGPRILNINMLLFKIAQEIDQPNLTPEEKFATLCSHYGKPEFLEMSFSDQVTTVCDMLCLNGHMTPSLLSIFRSLPIQHLLLSSSSLTISSTSITSLLRTLSRSFSFSSLTTLSLSSLPVPPFSLTHLHSLPLTSLDISNTNSTLESISHLICLRTTLRRLSLANNPEVNDGALDLLSYLSYLEELDLKGTETTLLPLRLLVLKAKISQPRLSKIDPPTQVADFVALSVKQLVDLAPLRPKSLITSFTITQLREEIRILDPDAKGLNKTSAALSEMLTGLHEKRDQMLQVIKIMGTKKDLSALASLRN